MSALTPVADHVEESQAFQPIDDTANAENHAVLWSPAISQIGLLMRSIQRTEPPTFGIEISQR